MLHHYWHSHLLLLELLVALAGCLLSCLLLFFLIQSLGSLFLSFLFIFLFLFLLLLDRLLLGQHLLGLHVLLQLLVEHLEHVIVRVFGLGDHVAVLVDCLNSGNDWSLLLGLSLSCWLSWLLLGWLRLCLRLGLGLWLLLILGFFGFGLSIGLW